MLRHYDAVYMFLWGKVDEQIAADLTQETFETICAKHERFRGDSSLRTYLFGIARWKLVNYFRGAQRARARFDPLVDGIDPEVVDRSVTSWFSHKEHEALLVRGLRSLPLDDQFLLELKDYEDLTARELAEILDAPPGTIAGRISRARERLRRAVSELSATQLLAEQTLEGLDAYFGGIRERMRDAVK